MIAQNEIKVQGVLANKNTVSYKHIIIAQSHISIIQGGFQYKLNNHACTIIPYPTVEMKHIRQVYVG